MEWFYFAVYFQGFLEASSAEASAFCLPDGIGLAGMVSDILDLTVQGKEKIKSQKAKPQSKIQKLLTLIFAVKYSFFCCVWRVS